MPGGRPSKYPQGDEARRKLHQEVLELSRDQGYSLVQISAALDIPRTTMLSWAEQHPEFSTVLTRARELQQAWWETRGQQGMILQGFNAKVWQVSMQARFKDEYTERRALEHTSPDGSMTPSLDASKLSDDALKELLEARRDRTEFERG